MHSIRDGVDVVGITGRLAMADASAAREQLKIIIENGSGNLLIDLSGLTFMDSSGCSVLISAFKSVRGRQGRLVLSCLSPEIQSLIELTRLNEIFEIFTDTVAALASLKAS
ncbi:STAS domain-containing protein [Methylomagnum sp.]